MSKPIKIPVFFHTETTNTFEDIGVEYPINSCELKDVYIKNYFYISPYEDNGELYSRIGVGDTNFITPIKPFDLIELLDE